MKGRTINDYQEWLLVYYCYYVITQAITLGEGWLAVCTDKRIVRIFTLGGTQREIFSIPGPVVCMSGHGSHLMVVYHSGRGMYFIFSVVGVILFICGGRVSLSQEARRQAGRRPRRAYPSPLPESPPHPSVGGATEPGVGAKISTPATGRLQFLVPSCVWETGNFISMKVISTESLFNVIVGLPGEQCLSVQLMKITGPKKKSLLNGDRIPLSEKGQLAWLGYVLSS